VSTPHNRYADTPLRVPRDVSALMNGFRH
jgi:hypothetical protein